jgi:hypothetical protein
MNVDFQVPGKRVTAGRLPTIYWGGMKIELVATRDIWRHEDEGFVF